MSKRFLAFVLCLVMFVTLLPGGGYADAAWNKLETGNIQLPPLEQANGEIIVQIFQDDAWLEAGSISFDKYVRKGFLELENFLPASGSVKIRLLQEGGGAAHLDAVLLGGRAPISVNDGGGLPLSKLAVQDNDLISIEPDGMEVLFAAGEGSILSVVARVEPLIISRTPFQFPCENMYKIMDENSAFYTYSLNPAGESLALGNMLAAVDGREPFYREYVVPGSGHPPDYIYGWVMNDGQNLYVAQEFTPDNTMDGDKDYAKVYVKTNEGLKEFKVTASEETWGKAYFTYTDKVNYQHKFYEFIIPLSEIGISEGGARDIQIAFGAYGTMSPTEPQKRNPALAYNSQENNYLCVYSYVDPDSGWWTEKIKGELVASDGTVIPGSQFTINDYDDCYNQLYPAVAYDSDNSRYLVVWMRSSGSGYKLYGQLVNADGTLEGELMELSASSASSYGISAAYDSINHKFLVTWDHQDTTPPHYWHVYGLFIDANTGSYTGEDKLDISASFGNGHYIQKPAIAFDSQNGRFLVVWADNRQNPGIVDLDIYGQFVRFAAPGEELVASNFAIASAPDSQADPSVAYDSVNHKYMVVWEDFRNLEISREDIYGCIMDADDTDNKVELEISGDEFPQWRPTVVYGNDNTGFWVAWKHVELGYEGEWVGEPGLHGRFVTAVGSMGETLYSNPGPTFDNAKPAAAFNSTDFSFLNAFEWFEEEGWDIPIDVAYWLIETESPESPATPLEVTSTLPANNAVGVLPSTDISITFSEEVWQSVYFNDITIMTGSTVVNYVYDGVGSPTLTLTPVEPLAYGTAHTVTIPVDAVKDSEENGLASPYSFNFTTQNRPGSGSSSRSTVEIPPDGDLIDRMPGSVALAAPVKITEEKDEIALTFDSAKMGDKHAARVYYWHTEAKKWVALASYPAGDGQVKALNDGGYKGWFKVFGITQPTFTDVQGHWAEPVINRMNGLGMIEGYSSIGDEITRLAKPDQSVTRNEFAVFLYRLLNIDPDKTIMAPVTSENALNVLEAKFTDAQKIPGWAGQMVAALVSAGHIEGRNGKFDGDAPITRIEAAVMVSSALKTLPGYMPINFDKYKDSADIPEWARAAVADNLVEGYPDGTLKPNDNITRAEAMTVLEKLFVNGMGW